MNTLPLPTLRARPFGARAGLAYTDDALFDACGVRIAFTTRQGGVSEGAYRSLNLGSHVKDAPEAVEENRRILLDALCGVKQDADAHCAADPKDALCGEGAQGGDAFCGEGANASRMPAANVTLIVPNQVHGANVLAVRSAADINSVTQAAAEGADALVIETAGVAANLCFADCCPLIVVAPTGHFAVIHAGWRGVDNLISVKTVRMLGEGSAKLLNIAAEEVLPEINVYIGAHIHAECFETGAEVHERFTKQFGSACAYDETHIDLNYCLRKQLTDAGIALERIADVGKCTVCNNDEFFSYRAQNGSCGRHGACAVRM